MAVYTTTATGAQDGSNVPPGVWFESNTTLTLNSLNPVGLQFLVPLNFDSEGRPLDPQLIYPSFDLTLNAATPPTADSTITVWFVPEAAPAPYSTTLLPTARSEEQLTTATWTAAATSLTITVPTLAMVEYMRHSDWNGILSLTLTDNVSLFFPATVHTSEGADPTLAPSIDTGTEIAFHTGFTDGPAFGRRARGYHCPRTGMPVATDELVRDGYAEGLMVSPSGWDPEDEEDRYVPSPLEGVLDDEI